MPDDEFDVLPASKRSSKRIIEEDDDFDEQQPIDATEETETKLEEVDSGELKSGDASAKASIDVPQSFNSESQYSYNPIKKRRVIKKKHHVDSSRRRDFSESTEDDAEKKDPSSGTSVDGLPNNNNADGVGSDDKPEDQSLASVSNSKEKVSSEADENKNLETKLTEPQSTSPQTVNAPELPKLEKPAWMTQEMWDQQQEKMKQSLRLVKSATAEEEETIKRPKRKTNKEEQMRQAEEFLRKEEEKETKMVQRNLANYQNMSQDEIIKFHYNQQTFASKKQKRSESKIYKLRSFNNCIKYILINKFGKLGGNVLDLGCGKGGDMAKWDGIQTKTYAGIDLSDQSIREAINRYRGSNYNFHAVFATGDAFKLPVNEILDAFKEEVPLEFDTVSMQFCLHYAFESEATVRSLLTNISNSLKVGGMFIGTIPSSDFICWKISKLPPNTKKWGNSIYSVDFQNDPPRDGVFRPPYGQVYNYFLQDAVDNVPEFVVPFELFRSLCEEYNLELRYKKNFVSMFNNEIPNMYNLLPRPLLQSMRREDGSYGVNGDDKDACSFYLAFAFEKVGYQ